MVMHHEKFFAIFRTAQNHLSILSVALFSFHWFSALRALEMCMTTRHAISAKHCIGPR
jgi:hypothetical protein